MSLFCKDLHRRCAALIFQSASFVFIINLPDTCKYSGGCRTHVEFHPGIEPEQADHLKTTQYHGHRSAVLIAS